MSRITPAAGLMVGILLASPARANFASEVGPNFQVNTFTQFAQFNPAVASDAAGDFTVVWQSVNQDGHANGIFGQRYDSSGATVGAEFQVNTYTVSAQLSPAVASDADGDFVVVWDAHFGPGGIFGQRYDSGGAAIGSEFRVETYPNSNQNRPAVASDAAGDFMVVWASLQDGNSSGIFGQRYDSSGAAVGAEFQVNTHTASSQFSPAVAADADGDFVVVWASLQDGNSSGIFGQRYNSAGVALGTEFQINTFTNSDQRRPGVASDANGAFAVVWESDDQDGSRDGIFGRRYDSSGAAVGSEFQVNTYTPLSQCDAAVASDADGDFVVVWHRRRQDGSYIGIFAQHYNSSGAASGVEFQINTYARSSLQGFPAVASDADGNFAVVWDNGDQDGEYGSIFAQRYALHASLCGAAPRGTCQTPGSSRLVLRNETHDKRDRASWRWVKGPATLFGDFGNPETTANYALCIYHGGNLLMEIDAPLGGSNCKRKPCWKQLGSSSNPKGFKYKDPSLTPNGAVSVLLKAGATHRAKATFKGTGIPLPDPALSLTEPVTVELVNDETAVCFGDTYTGQEIKRNSPNQFKGRARNP